MLLNLTEEYETESIGKPRRGRRKTIAFDIMYLLLEILLSKSLFADIFFREGSWVSCQEYLAG